MQTNDILWKGIIENLTEDFLRFFYPIESRLFDFSKGFIFLDQELAQIYPEGEKDNRYIDKLIQVYLCDGNTEWVLIHVEVQGYPDPDFPERMFIYHYRIRERFHRDIAALAIFTDKNPKFKPDTYRKEFLGTLTLYQFRTYKVLAQSEKELLKSDNPFAMVVLATLSALKKGKMDDAGIWQVKTNLVRLLYERQFPKAKILALFAFVNNYIRFEKPENSRIFAQEMMLKYEPNSSSMDIHELLIFQAKQEGLEKGLEKGIKQQKIQIILSAHQKGLPIDFIAEIVNLTVEEVQDIIRQHTL